jgi:hypothetical protein
LGNVLCSLNLPHFWKLGHDFIRRIGVSDLFEN